MKMLSIDRISSLRPIGTDVGAMGSGKAALPVPTVGPLVKVKAVAAVEPSPSLINQIGQSNKAAHAGLVYSNISDPSLRLLDTEVAPHDWTLKSAKVEKVEERQALPEMLIEHLKSLWVASASAVQTQQPSDEKQTLKSDKASPITTNVGSLPGLAMRYAPILVKSTANL